MLRIVLILLLTATFFATCGWADTVTLRSNAEINGSVSYEGGAFSISAKYKSGTKISKFDRAEVRTVEINARNFNPGEPPKDISIFEDRTASTRDAADKQKRSPAATPTKSKTNAKS